MSVRWAIYIATAMLADVLGGTLIGTGPLGAVVREILELRQSVNQIIQNQKNIQTALIQNAAMEKTLMEQSIDKVNKLTGTMMALQKNVQDIKADSSARHDTVAMQVQGISENLEETMA